MNLFFLRYGIFGLTYVNRVEVFPANAPHRNKKSSKKYSHFLAFSSNNFNGRESGY